MTRVTTTPGRDPEVRAALDEVNRRPLMRFLYAWGMIELTITIVVLVAAGAIVLFLTF